MTSIRAQIGSDAKDRLTKVYDSIERAAKSSNRDKKDITLVAVSKTYPVEDIYEFIELGVTTFGENRVQEALPKIEDVKERGKEKVSFHLIGSLQRNKVRQIVGKVSLIHSVDSERLLNEINLRAKRAGIVQDILVQVNLVGEEQKGGVSKGALQSLVSQAVAHANVNLRGFMFMPPIDEAQNSRRYFKEMKGIFDMYSGQYRSMDTLSMGMSGDYEVAIEEGATMVRVGSLLFGAREY